MTAKRLPLEDRIVQLVTRLDMKLKVKKALLFGSTAKGERLLESDVDIVVVSRDFEGMSVPERQAQIQKEWDGDEEIQALAYTPEEFSQVSNRLTLREILSHAKEVSPCREGDICPRCGQRGSLQNKIVRNRVGKRYVYQYFAHYKKGGTRWCYIGKPKPGGGER